MKRGLILFLAAALAFVGCKKEVATGVQGGDQTVTFSVVADNAATKADDVTSIPETIDTCVAVVRMYDAHNVLIGDVYASPKCTKFGESYKFSVDLMGGQKYEVTVLLYTKNVYTVDPKLEAIQRAAAELPYNLHAKHDLFSASITYQAGDNTPLIIAKRPFAQLNLITTDLVQNFEPVVTVKYTAPSTFNAVTGEASGARVYETLGVVTSYDYAPNQCTISSDYIFASNEKSLISVEMKAEKVGTFVRTFDNLPLQRNYKTNVIGKLLTVDSPFTVQVNADWYTPANDIQWQNAENIAAANAILADAPVGKDLNIKVNMPKDAAAQKITFTPKNSNTNTTFKFENNFASEDAEDKTITFTKDAEGTVMPASVTIEAPAGTNLVFEKETHVVINGTNYGVIKGTFSANTLVINKGVSVEKVIMTAGGLEVHGTLGAFEAAEGHGAIIVRDCEGLSEEVYNALSSFIAAGYKGFKQADGTWNISLSDVWFDRVANQPASFILDEVAKTIHLGDENAFAWFGKNSNKFGNKSYKIYLDADMNLESGWWTPIPFFFPEDHAIFDGQNHVIKNLKLSGSKELGLFGGIAGLDIKNLTIDGAIINATSGGYIGTVAYNSYGNFENISVKNTTIFGTYWAIGGVVGFHNAGNLKNCHVENLHITGGCPGGLVGVYNETRGPRVYENCTATSITLKDNCGWGKPYRYGAIVAVVNWPLLTLKNCSSTEMTYVYKSDSNVYHSGDEGIGTYAPSHALYGDYDDGCEVTIE